jgi:propionate CoA-transferase
MTLKTLPNKLAGVDEALSFVKDSSSVAVSGFNMAATPEHLILNLFERFQKTGHPRNLFMICESLPAISGRALDLVSEKIVKERNEDFLQGLLIPFLGFSPWTQKAVEANLFETYSWPIGVVSYWFREIASGRPGLVTNIGIDTLLDPRREGGAMNSKATEKMTCKVDLIHIEGEEFLFYHAPKPHFALIRASVSDERGNLSMEDEGVRGTVLNISQATKARPEPGFVIAQVRWITKSGTMNPREVDVPSPLVDCFVISPKQHHWQGGTFEYDPRISYRVIQPVTMEVIQDILPPVEQEFEKIIARRVLLELIKILEEKQSPVLVNLGVGIPALVSAVAAEEDLMDCILTVLESGPWGGIALSGADFGLAFSPFALSTMPDMFSNFEGGVIDAASLGFLQIDEGGSVNPSMLPGRIYGPGGFPVIAGGAPRTFFSGAFTAGLSKMKIEEGELKIIEDGPVSKFVHSVYRVFFSGKEAIKHDKEILYVTERAVFRLTREGVMLEEIAPGVDLEKQVLRKMEFAPKISTSLKTMEKSIFLREKMNLRKLVFSA